MSSRKGLPTDVAKALSHPLRQQLLIAYNQAPASPGEIADRLGEPLGNVAYHTKRLVEHGCLELVDTTRGRGGTKHGYRAVVRFELEGDAWRDLPSTLRSSIAARAVSEIGRELVESAAVGGLDDADVHLSLMVLELDDRGWRELTEMLRDTVARADRIVDQSTRRGPGTRRSVLAVMHFRTGSVL